MTPVKASVTLRPSSFYQKRVSFCHSLIFLKIYCRSGILVYYLYTQLKKRVCILWNLKCTILHGPQRNCSHSLGLVIFIYMGHQWVKNYATHLQNHQDFMTKDLTLRICFLLDVEKFICHISVLAKPSCAHLSLSSVCHMFILCSIFTDPKGV